VPDSVVLILVAALALYAIALLVLFGAGRRQDARALAGFVPDCVVLFKRLVTDPRVLRRHKVLLALTLGYLLSPIDLVPDFIPVLGQMDDLIVVALALRRTLRGASGASLTRELWPGPPRSLRVIERLAGAGRDARAGQRRDG